MARTDTVNVNGSDMRAYVAVPAGTGPHPAVIVMCHIGGLDEFTEDRCDRLAAEGYVAAAPDVFHYHDWIEDKGERRATLHDKTIVEDINATLDHIEAAESINTDRIAIVGHCMGGRTALLGTGAINRFCATALYYGGRTMLSWGGDGPTPFELIPNINGPVIGFYGNHDQEPAPADVDKIEAEMKRNGLTVEFHRYADAGHAFQDHTNPERYHQASADDAWQKNLAFLRQVMV